MKTSTSTVKDFVAKYAKKKNVQPTKEKPYDFKDQVAKYLKKDIKTACTSCIKDAEEKAAAAKCLPFSYPLYRDKDWNIKVVKNNEANLKETPKPVSQSSGNSKATQTENDHIPSFSEVTPSLPGPPPTESVVEANPPRRQIHKNVEEQNQEQDDESYIDDIKLSVLFLDGSDRRVNRIYSADTLMTQCLDDIMYNYW